MRDTKQGIRLRHAWVVWALFGLFSACGLYARGGAEGHPVPFTSALLLGQVDAHLYFLATIPVLSLAEHFRPGRGNRLALVLLCALGCVAFPALVLTAQSTFQLWYTRPAGLGAVTPAHTIAFVLDKFNEGLYAYWLAVLAPYAYAFYTGRRRDSLQPPPPGADPPHREPGDLKARLRPHFLFNTLNTITTLMHEDVKAAEAMLINTSAFLRGALSEAPDVPLRFELDTLRGYLHMEAARFEEGVSVRVEVDPAVEWARVPNMLLLPLAAEAIKHDAAGAAFGKRIVVEARREGDWLRILVSNDGDSAKETPPRDGSGLAETGDRLSRIYGPSHRFETRHSPGGGFLVNIEIPFRRTGPL